jgi:formiminotetrahydrofolate cyclodeaminase
MLMDTPARELLDAFSSPQPTPGGGSASALAGAIGASLLMMVAALPKTRNGTDADRSALDDARARLGLERDRLAGLVDGDTAAYERVVSAYRLPKGTDEEKTARKAAIQEALGGAIDTPLDIMRGACAALDLAGVVARHGNPSAWSDVRVGLALLGAALEGARVNVEINLGSLTDAGRSQAISEEAARLAESAAARRDAALSALTT